MNQRLLVFAACLLTVGSTHAATSQRTFVASGGNDANPCSLVAPCRSFASAIAFTQSGGEVIVLDSAGYGPVIVTQSVSIVAPPGVYAGISVPATGNATGVMINTAGVNVVLRGLTINGTGGSYGVWMQDGAKLEIENCTISNFDTAPGIGILIQAAAYVSIAGSTIRDGIGGVVAGYGAIVNVANSQVLLNANLGIGLGGGSGTSTGIFITDTVVTGTGQLGSSRCVENAASAGSLGLIEATRVTVTSCKRGFLNAPQDTGTMTVSRSTASNNFIGFQDVATAGATFQSLGDNHVTDNGTDTFGSITIVGPH